MEDLIIRTIKVEDADDVLEIYRFYVEKTAITFEYTVPTIDDWISRIEKVTHDFPWLVAEVSNQIVGYAYATKFRERVAYSWVCESSIYLKSDFQGKGVAKKLYEELFSILKRQNYISIIAVLTTPNEKSEKFHSKMGFNSIGIYEKVGYKFAQWHDVKWMQINIAENQIPPNEIVSFKELT